MLNKFKLLTSIIIKKVIKVFHSLIYVIGCMTVCLFSINILFPDAVGDCLDLGGVWDNEYKSCRFDCNHWNEKDGCILLTDEELTDYVNGYCSGEGKGLYRCEQAKLELSKRILRDKMLENKQAK